MWSEEGLDEKIDEGVLRWFSHVERMERDRIPKRVYVGECAGNHSVDRPWKRLIDCEGVTKEKRFGCQTSNKNGPGCE